MQCLLDIPHKCYAMLISVNAASSQQPAAAASSSSSQQHRHLSTFRATLISLGEIARRI
jgi:hypothetical protein